jgi:hypothetical protein
MRTGAFILASNLLLFAPVIWGQTSDSTTDAAVEREVLETQAHRFQAMIDVDLETLENILSGDLTYTHTSGWMENKGEFLSSLRSQLIKYKSIRPTDVVIRIYNYTAVVTGISAMRIIYKENPLAFSIRFIEVYQKNQGNWQLVAWQASRLSDE